MRMMTVGGGARAAVIVLSMATAACTITTTPGGDDSSGSTPTGTETVEDQCTTIGTAVCEALPMCNIPTSGLSDCLSNYTESCCSGAQCSEVSGSSDDAVQACVAAYQPPDCNGLVNSVTPDACMGVPQIP